MRRRRTAAATAPAGRRGFGAGRARSILCGIAAVMLGASVFGAISGFRGARRPPILFVSRNASPASAPGVTAGQGPLGRTLTPGGTLLVLEPDGRVRPFLREDSGFFDVCDPSVSFDGSRVLFAAAEKPGGAFRIYLVDADGTHVRPVTGNDSTATGAAADPAGVAAHGHAPGPAAGSAAAARFDDLDPCWLPDGRIVFASTRFGMEDQVRGGPVTNLYVIHADGTSLQRITTDRNGAEEPAVDPVTGRVIYSRWWFNPYMAGASAPITTDPGEAAPGDRVDLWQTVSVTPDGDAVRLAAGNPLLRAEQMVYQAAPAANGAVFGINAAGAALFPEPGATRLVAFDAPIGPLRALTPPGRAASPAFLDDGTLLFSWSAGAPAGRGAESTGSRAPVRRGRPGHDRTDLDLCTIDPRGGAITRILDRPGTDELDAVPLAARPVPPVITPIFPPPITPGPKTDEAVLHDMVETFRFDCLNVFLSGGVDAPFPDAPKADPELFIRFFAVLARPGSALGDTLVLVREAPLTRTGAVHEHDLPADVPMFEQIVDREGRIVRTTNGPAHVPGYNYARIGSGTKCVGCHTGHSTLTVPLNYERSSWFNAAPSAAVRVSSASMGSVPARLVDRRAAGPVDRTGWVADGAEEEWVRLEWRFPIEAREVIVYAAESASRDGTDLTVGSVDVVLLREDREAGRFRIRSRLDSKGSRLEIPPTVIDAVELRPRRISGRVRGRTVAALSEIEVTARIVE